MSDDRFNFIILFMYFKNYEMKKLILICLLASLLPACKKKNNTSSATTTTTTAGFPDCSGGTPGYAATVSGIISSNCAVSGCHNSGSANGPGPLTTHAQIKNSAASIRSAVISGSMPKNSSLTTAQKNSIVCWIDAGAPNN